MPSYTIFRKILVITLLLSLLPLLVSSVTTVAACGQTS